MEDSDNTDCPCVGSMGLHQNNLLSMSGHQQESLPGFMGLNPNQYKNRSVIDVFRDMRDKYFGKPEINAKQKTSQCKIELEYEEEEDRTSVSIDTLPVYCKLMILSFLDTCDVCSVSSINSQWREVANDQILWRELLIRDMCKWDSMTNKSHPLISQVWKNDTLKHSSISINLIDLLYGNGMKNATFPLSTITQKNSIADNSESNKRTNINANKGVNFKALYIHSSFQRAQDDLEEVHNNLSIPGFIKSLWHGGVTPEQGEIIMTGPGMDSPRTSKIFRALMWGSHFLETKGLLAGNRDGIGSGVQLLFKEKIPFNLIALYSGNNRVRETRVGMERLLHSNVVEVASNDGNEEEIQEESNSLNITQFVLYEAVRFYIAERKGIYKLIYVVDATFKQKWEDISCNKLELAAILKGTEYDSTLNAALNIPHQDQTEPQVQQNAYMNTNDEPDTLTPSAGFVSPTDKRPLLVLSCVADPSIERFSCMQITAMLNLPSVTDRQWRVQDVVVSTMSGVEKGLEWLLRQP